MRFKQATKKEGRKAQEETTAARRRAVAPIAIALIAALLLALVPARETAAVEPLTDYQKSVIEQWRATARYYEAIEGIPYTAALTYFCHESGFGTSDAVRDYRHNGFGIHQYRSSKLHVYPSVSESWAGFYRLLHQNPDYAAAGAFTHPNDPVGCILAIAGVYNSADPSYKKKVTSIYYQIAAYERERLPQIIAAEEAAEKAAAKAAKAEREAQARARAAKATCETVANLRDFRSAEPATSVPVAGASDLAAAFGPSAPIAGATAETSVITVIAGNN